MRAAPRDAQDRLKTAPGTAAITSRAITSEEPPMIMEMRVYRCLPGRLPALMKRFDTLTLKLWDKHGIKQAGFYTTLIGTSNQELTYFVAWDSLAERERKWTAFQSDPDWIAGRATG